MIENYKELLFTIFNTDVEKNEKSVICVYDTKEDDRLIAIFNSSKSCGKFFKTSPRAINKSICRKELRNCRYRLERVIVGE
jgi:hypothetical protein